MKKTIFIGLFFYSLFIVSALGLDYTGFYEPFNNDSRIQALDTVILNISSSSIGFNMSANFIPAPEDLTTYTEYEENEPYINQIDVINSTTLHFRTDLQYGAYLVYDFGENYFQDFIIDFDIFWASTLGSLNRHYACGLAQELGDRSDLTANYTLFALNRQNVYNVFRYQFVTNDNGAGFSSGWITDASIYQDWLYLRVIKADKSLKWLCYNNTDRTSLRFSYNVTLDNDQGFRYFYPALSYDLALYADVWIDGYFKNLQGCKYSGDFEGTFYSVDLLSGISSNASAILYNAQLEGSNRIGLEVSNNNSTWLQLQPISMNNGSGAFSLDGLGYSTLYLRGNFTRPNGAGLCDLQDLTVIYEGGAASAGRDWILILLLPLGLLLGLAANNLSKGGQV